ncbi:hypothetical protein WB66_04140 [bacteria symbiont BFo1 of Frankliniella occidentalis]|jgi:hypothetical protein|nr:hypothetical protein AI28_14500 [bacteria symbiont BFo1 of Frankliniella occidentalis]KYP86305.1 hypothetical protein WB66_04140 [bacteria symbiont BFo1 of Frankliniella occidentalis]KYP91611.1 hypothetical protein WB91_04100 [bacteria symbiont BFo1 of Frankliniella occidentalis]PIJ56716.1 hypothetical protein BOM23_15485 [Erwinia sp. OLMDLW33]CAH0305687.1 hypothetical protein SRABI13_04551 [Erwinia aphidicola]
MLICLQKSNISLLLIHAAVNGLLQRFSLHFQACFGNHTATAIKKPHISRTVISHQSLWK